MNLLNALLSEMVLRNLDGYILFHTDEHLNEFISNADMRVKKLTGFTGSNGTAVITRKESVLYTDSRYYLQAQDELIEPFKLMRMKEDKSIFDFLKDTIGEGRVGINLRYISYSDYNSMKKQFNNSGLDLVPVDTELFDIVWKDKPSRDAGDVIDIEKFPFAEYITFLKNAKVRKIFDELFKDAYKYEYEEFVDPGLIPGISCENKIKIVRTTLNDDECMIITNLDSIAWLLNLRGKDISNNTVFYAYVYVSKTDIVLFSDSKVPRNIKVRKYGELYNFLSEIRESTVLTSEKINADIVNHLETKKVKTTDLIEKLKSIKNKNEIQGFFQAAILDGVALVKLFSWLSNTSKQITEIDVKNKLLTIKQKMSLDHSNEMFRSDINVIGNNKQTQMKNNHISLMSHGILAGNTNGNAFNGFISEVLKERILHSKNTLANEKENPGQLMDISSSISKNSNFNVRPTGFLFSSFETIVGYAKNGAIIHHSPTNTLIGKNGLILTDSGSQYIFATTDISRTIHLGIPSNDEMHDFTVVLKGQLLAKRLTGPAKDISGLIYDLPKYYLWKENKEYEHGTGHGIGTALYVHESPPKIIHDHEIMPHQIFTIEPGYYKKDKYGMRIEDAVISLCNGNIFLQNMTFVPLQLDLIDASLLNDEEVEYINTYNKNVRDILGEYIHDENEYEWLIQNTRFFEASH